MYRILSKALLSIATVALGALAAAPAHAADSSEYPSKPIRIVYPWAPGGGMETALRIMADRMSTTSGQPVVVENRTGGGGSIAAQAVATSDPDGYTVLVVPIGIVSITPHLRKLPFDARKDFDPVAQLSRFDAIIAATNKHGFKSMQDLIEYAKANPGKLTYASAGVGTQGHLIGEMAQRAWGIKLLHVPYKGAAETITDLIEGRIDLSFDVTMLQHAKEGKVNLLATFTDERLKDFPDVPTLAEAGVAKVDSATWFGAFVAAGTPKDRAEKLAGYFNESMQNQPLIDRMAIFAMRPAFAPADEFEKIWETDYDRYGKLIRELDIKVE